MIILFLTAGYLALSILLFGALGIGKKRTPFFRMPRSAILFYLLSCTWGLPMTLIGLVVSLVLLLAGKKPVRYGRIAAFLLPGIRFGVSFGPFMIAPAEEDEPLRMHEHGHSIQNVYLGPFMLPVVAIPSFLRFWARAVKEKLTGRPCKKPYDEIWFERSASVSGRAFFTDKEKSGAPDGKNGARS